MALRRSARWALALCAVAAALPASAHADHGTTFLDEGLATYMSVAEAHWGGGIPTCVENGFTLIRVHAILYDDPDPSVAARADQPGCRIWLDRSSWREMLPLERCMIVLHEWGHLLGHGHSPNALDLMAELPVRAPAECRRVAPARRRPSARAARRCTRRPQVRSALGARARAVRHGCARRIS
jgi:hypothetical protein